MNLAQLMEKGGFVSPDLVKTSVTWDEAEGGPATFDVYIKEASAGAVERGARAIATEAKAAGVPVGESFAQRPAMVAAMVFFDPAGKEGFTYAQACELKDSLCAVLFNAANEAHTVAAQSAKNSQPATSSGASSSQTASADAQ